MQLCLESAIFEHGFKSLTITPHLDNRQVFCSVLRSQIASSCHAFCYLASPNYKSTRTACALLADYDVRVMDATCVA